MNLLTLVPWWARALVLVAFATALIGFGYVKGSEHEEAKFDAYKTQEQAATLKAVQVAGEKTHAWQVQKDEALDAATKRAQANAVAAAAATRTVDSLRDQLATANARLSSATAEAVREYATAAGAVFGECAKALTELATKADGHATDAAALEAAWPKP